MMPSNFQSSLELNGLGTSSSGSSSRCAFGCFNLSCCEARGWVWLTDRISTVSLDPSSSNQRDMNGKISRNLYVVPGPSVYQFPQLPYVLQPHSHTRVPSQVSHMHHRILRDSASPTLFTTRTAILVTLFRRSRGILLQLGL